MTLSPCLDCGTPSEGTRCPDCRPKHNTARRRGFPASKKTSARSRGYDTAWRNLSERARKLQPWCTDCGATTDLQADHSPEAWRRKATGLPVRLQDVEVVCGQCNRARGRQRPK